MNNKENILIVYFSSPTGMTRKFVEKLGFEAKEIPLRPKEPELLLDKDQYYILATPTMGGGNAVNKKNAVPKQVLKFLKNETNRNNCIGVLGSGNTNFGRFYLLAPKMISNKLKVPFLGGFELAGMPGDAEEYREKIEKNWGKLLKNHNETIPSQ